MKHLSQRLMSLAMMSDPYDEIWDLCCDHGKLAIYLAEKFPLKKVYALDCLEHQIKKIPNNYNNLKAFWADATVFNYNQYRAEKKPLFIIAGVGSHTANSIIDHLNKNYQGDYDLLICIHQKTFLTRTFLNKKDYGFIKEEFIKEQNKEYDLLLCSKINNNIEIPLINQKIDQERQESLMEYFNLKQRYAKEKEIYSNLIKALKKISREVD